MTLPKTLHITFIIIIKKYLKNNPPARANNLRFFFSPSNLYYLIYSEPFLGGVCGFV